MNTEMKLISDFEVIDHGIENEQYFQGCGTSFTKYDHCVTGAGSSAYEAFDDAIEQIAQCGFDTAFVAQNNDGERFSSEEAKAASVTAWLKSQGYDEADDAELYYYVSIRWS